MSVSNIKELFCKKVKETENVSDVNVEDMSNVDVPCLTETEAGITEYLSPLEGFKAVIKERFSDFQVREIDLDGNIARVTSTDLPKWFETLIEEDNFDILDNETWEKLEKLIKDEVQSVEIDVSNDDKEKRTKIHKCLKKKYGTTIMSNTKEDGGKKYVVVSKPKVCDKRWPPNVGKYLHFIMCKTNCETHVALGAIATRLRRKLNSFTYAGTKDKRGVTSQWICIKHLAAEDVKPLVNGLKNMKIGNFIYKRNPLKLGSLSGNLFEIVLRNVEATDDAINCSLNQLNDMGFLNYFGLQRFGNSALVPTHEIGKCLARGEFRSAVELILKPRMDNSRGDLKRAREIWWRTKDAAQAFRVLRSRQCTIEGRLLNGLATHGANAYVNALDLLPRNVRLLYLHAYQSFLWNIILSKRIKKYGMKVLKGDLVLTEKLVETHLEVEDVEECGEAEEVPTTKGEVRCITEDEVDNFKIYDIVHPLAGYAVTYPDNEIKEWYEELLHADGLTSEKLKQTVRAYALSGSYRHIVKKVKDLSWKIVYYSDPTEDILESDFGVTVKKESLTVSDKTYKGLILSFSLDPSTYATMVLREILKIDTSVSYQKTLNSYSKKRERENEVVYEEKIKMQKTS